MIVTGLLVFAGLLAFGYGVLMLFTANGFRRVLRDDCLVQNLPSVSVIVPARNERATIEECVDRILSNDYPADRLQLIVVDDGSSDGTSETLARVTRERSSTRPELTVLCTHGGESGKGEALDAGIAASTGEIVVTTDADCFVGARWLRSMVAAFESDVGFVAGPVVNHPGRSPKENLESLDFLALVGFGAGTIGMGFPTICNSANAAYRRVLLNEWRATYRFSQAPAGDELLMHFVHSATPYRVRFASSPDAVVRTTGSSSISQFWTQRSRWASSIPFFPVQVISLAAMVFAFYLAIAAALVASLWSPPLLAGAVVGLVVKSLADGIVVVPVCRHFCRRALLKYFVLAEVFHIPYIICAVLSGILGRVHWKGRELGPEMGHIQRSITQVANVNEWDVDKAS